MHQNIKHKFSNMMKTVSSSAAAVFVALVCLFSFIGCNAETNGIDQKVHIVYMGDRSTSEFSATAQHMSLLQATLGSKRASESWLYSYKRSFNGFVAKLTEEEKNRIAALEGVVSVFPSTKKQLHTTRSWDFMGFPTTSPKSQTESEVVVGLLDTGIWPESASFNDSGFGAPPAKWKGTCQSSCNFTCNNKIIGARYYNSEGSVPPGDFDSPRDSDGHGTHTASTAAGSLVYGASMLGLAEGTARGAVPSSRIAVYKVCWGGGCSDADILAAFDDAIADGVDIISVSLGGSFPSDYFEDSIAIGAFHAMKNGILTSNSAGNSGPQSESIVNISPWSLSVAASVIDRKFLAKVQLGNNKSYEGISVNTFTLGKDSYPLVSGGGCNYGELDPKLVNGTIVLCETLNDGSSALDAGAIGTVMKGDYYSDFGFSYPLAASYLNSSDGGEVFDYINSTSKPSAVIFKSVEVNETKAPFVVSFSSRGPNPITSDILKPDLTAPGVDILAAWSAVSSPAGLLDDPRRVPFNIISGTSMSCPHASGAAAYVKSFNPTWSPSAIKSALMTTATVMTLNDNKDGEFAYGSGHIDPVKAKAPGLVYDIAEADYVSFLCGQGYSNKNLKLVTGDNTTCTAANNSTVYDLNYPSFTVSTAASTNISRVFHRTVTNVGSASSTYKVRVLLKTGLSVLVEPETLSFQSLGEKQTFTVTVNATVGNNTKMLHGSLVWYDGTYRVRSPIVAYAVYVE